MGAPPLALRPGRVLSIGRADECDLSVPSKRVSRRHAEIDWRDGMPIVRDLGSQNGTLVNGKRVKGEQLLEDGDELEFGPFLCTYRFQQAASGARPAAPDLNALTQPMMADAIAGRLDQINLAELLQTLEFNCKSGTLEVFGSDGEGLVVLQEGKPTYASCADKSGEEAIYQLLAFKSGQFSFGGDLAETERNVSAPMGSILMEACRRLDEGS